MRQTIRLSLVGLATALTLAGCSGAQNDGESPTAAPSAAIATNGATTDLTKTTSVPMTGAPSPGSGAAENSSPTTPAKSSSKNLDSAASFAAAANSSRPASHSAGRPSEAASPQRGQTSGEPVSYVDERGDAYGAVPRRELNQPSLDIVSVAWAPVSHAGEHRFGYSTSITVTGTPQDDGLYVSWGEFPSDVPGEACQLYNVLAPGATAFANAFCGSISTGTRRFIGSLEGSVVASTSAAGGTTLSATFDDPAIPRELESADRTLFNLAAFSARCPAEPQSPCEVDVWDSATSNLSYRV